MAIPSSQDIARAFQTAPDYVKSYIASGALTSTFEKIRTEHKLHLDEAGKLSRSLNAVFLKLADSSEFPALLKESLEQNSGAYDDVLKAVNEEIFTDFRRQLQSPPPAEEPAPTIQGTEQKLSTPTSERTKHVATDTLAESQTEEPAPAAQNYSDGSDPYREPIE